MLAHAPCCLNAIAMLPARAARRPTKRTARKAFDHPVALSMHLY